MRNPSKSPTDLPCKVRGTPEKEGEIKAQAAKRLQVAADGFGVAGGEVGDEEEGDAEDDECDEAVGALLAPDVEDDYFGDADEEEAEASAAEATFRDDKSGEEGGDNFEAPAHGDAGFG